ncbi:uncharacterized protein F5891DRAFT_1233577 [Suillus fuscotomentosus]|uniref:Fe2OG dioxygenase domain-containing protein n=1 Tax=Suillus fuscotomentosus TaxID=1912939 RepID=A0AAD4DNB4_9AGAM|nr:uncharacterized protein F5891DRAFT_1233577 [Suillus fuscotomentosus]KAG1885351.1 hypothetical protein F5891DRAFT_1233577 [Suillus fuscotomentosus]
MLITSLGFLEKVESGKAQVAGSGFGGKGHRRQIPSNVMGNADFPGVRRDHTTQVPSSSLRVARIPFWSFVSSTLCPTTRFLTKYADPAVYPHFDLYPARAAKLASREEDITNNKLFISSSTYPLLSPTFFMLAWDDPKANRGYVQVGRERVTTSMDAAEIAVLRAKAPDTKESMEIGCENHPTFSNKWPQETEVPRFKQTMLHFFQTFHEVHTMVMKSIALGLDLPEDFFDNKIDHYGTLTLLFQDSIGGLEVQNPHTKHYQPASPIPGTIVVNAGDLLARWSNDVLRSTLHRVVAPPATKINATEGMTPARQSIAFFCNPNFDAIIESLPTCTSTSNPSRYPPLTTEQYIVGRLATTYS